MKCKVYGKVFGVIIVDLLSSVKKVNNGVVYVVVFRKNGVMLGKKIVIVWFKYDLWIDDYFGFVFVV